MSTIEAIMSKPLHNLTSHEQLVHREVSQYLATHNGRHGFLGTLAGVAGGSVLTGAYETLRHGSEEPQPREWRA